MTTSVLVPIMLLAQEVIRKAGGHTGRIKYLEGVVDYEFQTDYARYACPSQS